MFLTRVFYAGLCLCTALPALADGSAQHRRAPLSISADAGRNAAPSLTAFVRQVWAESPAVQGAKAALEAARARADGADKPLHNPSLEMDAERTDISTTSVGLVQTIDWSDKRGALTRIAGQELKAAEAELRDTRLRVATEAFEGLVRYSTAREMQMLAQRRGELMRVFIDAVEQRRAAGDLGALDVTLAQVAYSEALMAQAAAESERAEAEADLLAVSGVPADRWPTLPAELAPPPDRADPALLENLPQLAVLRHRMEAARARIALAQREGQVDPTIGLRAGRDASENLLGVNIEIPLFVRNNLKTLVRAASREAVVEEQAYRDAQRRALARLSAAQSRFRNTSRAWQTWASSGQQALHRQMDLLENMWQAGELTATDFLIQARQNIDTQTTATTLMGEVWRSAVAWLAASGQIDSWLGLATRDTDTNSGEQK